MKPVAFGCVARLPLGFEELGAKILAVEEWSTFRGWGPIPGIESATFLEKTPAVVGSRIAVKNLDGSRHVEEVTVWEPGVIALRMSGFSNPVLSRLATHFEETWQLDRTGERETLLTRSFALHPRNLAGALALRIIARMLRRAAVRQLDEMASAPRAVR